jgi:hypothetical protein
MFDAPHSVTRSATASTTGLPAIGLRLSRMPSPTNGGRSQTAFRIRSRSVGLLSRLTTASGNPKHGMSPLDAVEAIDGVVDDAHGRTTRCLRSGQEFGLLLLELGV